MFRTHYCPPPAAYNGGTCQELDPAAQVSVAAPRILWGWKRHVKRLVDVIGATGFFVLLGPLYLAVALAVRISMGAPVHYWQPRQGKGGQEFQFFKFRSMLADSDHVLHRHLSENEAARQHWMKYQKLVDDPRVTPLGRFLRRLSLDELPQFWNVLKGDMSLVGPRPCLIRQQSLYGKHWPHYCAVRPGITGLWQVSGRNRLSYAERARLDAHYVENWSLALDSKILIRTLWTVVSGEGSH